MIEVRELRAAAERIGPDRLTALLAAHAAVSESP
jgi:hypothetical protein